MSSTISTPDAARVTVSSQPVQPVSGVSRRSVANARWNLLRAVVTSIVGFFSTPILLKSFSDGDFAGWVLVSSVTSYLTIADIGLAVEVVRTSAKAHAEGDQDTAFDTIKAVMRLQGLLTLCMSVLLVAVTVAFPYVFSSVPAASVSRAQIAFVGLGITSLAAMALNPMIAHQIGLQRMDIGAKAAIGSRVLAFGWIWWSAHLGLAWVATGVALLYTMAFAVAAAYTYRIEPTFRLRGPFKRSQPYATVTAFAKRRLVWFLGVFAVITFDVTIVGHFAFKDLVPFSLALSLVSICYVAFEAIAGTLVPHIAALTRMDHAAEARWLHSFYLFTNGLAAVICLGMGAISVFLVPRWVGGGLSKRVLALLFPMLVVTFVRMVLDGLSGGFVALNEQRRCMWNHVREALVKLPVGLVLVQRFGAGGLVWAGFVGALVALLVVLATVMPTSAFRLPVRGGVGTMLVYLALTFGALALHRTTHAAVVATVLLAACGLVATHLFRSGVLADVGIIHRRQGKA